MSRAQILLIVAALVAVASIAAVVWIRRRRTGHVLVTDARTESPQGGRP